MIVTPPRRNAFQCFFPVANPEDGVRRVAKPSSRLKVQKLRDQSEVSIRSGYGLGTHWVHSYTAWDIYAGIHMIYGVSTECVQTEGGWDDNIGLNQCRIDF